MCFKKTDLCVEERVPFGTPLAVGGYEFREAAEVANTLFYGEEL